MTEKKTIPPAITDQSFSTLPRNNHEKDENDGPYVEENEESEENEEPVETTRVFESILAFSAEKPPIHFYREEVTSETWSIFSCKFTVTQAPSNSIAKIANNIQFDAFRELETGWILVKWKGMSYVHATWERARKLYMFFEHFDVASNSQNDKLGYITMIVNAYRNMTAWRDEFPYNQERAGCAINPMFIRIEQILLKKTNKEIDEMNRIAEGREKTEEDEKEKEGGDDVCYVLKWAYEVGFRARERWGENDWETEWDVMLAPGYAQAIKRLDLSLFGRHKVKPGGWTPVTLTHTLPDRWDAKEPGGICAKPYQQVAVEWIIHNFNAGRSCILADEMGLGKTITACLLAEIIVKTQGQVLIITPNQVINQFYQEIIKWTQLRVLLLRTVEPPNSMDVLKQYEFDVCITTPNTLRPGTIAEKFVTYNKRHWAALIVDEGHNVKNTASAFSTLVATKIKFNRGVLLTGSPIQNRIEETWNMIDTINKNTLRSNTAYWTELIDKFKELDRPEKLEDLCAEFALYMYRRFAQDVLSLPDRNRIVYAVQLDEKEATKYNAYIGDRKSVSTGDINKLCEICGGAGTRKMHILGELVDEIAKKGQRAVIFSHWVNLGDDIVKMLRTRGHPYRAIVSKTKSGERQRIMDAFNAPDQVNITFLVMTTSIGSTGLNLTGATNVILYTTEWNPQEELQAEARCYRQGQNHPVTVHRFFAIGSVEQGQFDVASGKLGVDIGIRKQIRNEHRAATLAYTGHLNDAYDCVRLGMFNIQEILNAPTGPDKPDYTETASKSADGVDLKVRVYHTRGTVIPMVQLDWISIDEAEQKKEEAAELKGLKSTQEEGDPATQDQQTPERTPERTPVIIPVAQTESAPKPPLDRTKRQQVKGLKKTIFTHTQPFHPDIDGAKLEVLRSLLVRMQRYSISHETHWKSNEKNDVVGLMQFCVAKELCAAPSVFKHSDAVKYLTALNKDAFINACDPRRPDYIKTITRICKAIGDGKTGMSVEMDCIAELTACTSPLNIFIAAEHVHTMQEEQHRTTFISANRTAIHVAYGDGWNYDGTLETIAKEGFTDIHADAFNELSMGALEDVFGWLHELSVTGFTPNFKRVNGNAKLEKRITDLIEKAQPPTGARSMFTTEERDLLQEAENRLKFNGIDILPRQCERCDMHRDVPTYVTMMELRGTQSLSAVTIGMLFTWYHCHTGKKFHFSVIEMPTDQAGAWLADINTLFFKEADSGRVSVFAHRQSRDAKLPASPWNENNKVEWIKPPGGMHDNDASVWVLLCFIMLLTRNGKVEPGWFEDLDPINARTQFLIDILRHKVYWAGDETET